MTITTPNMATSQDPEVMVRVKAMLCGGTDWCGHHEGLDQRNRHLT